MIRIRLSDFRLPAFLDSLYSAEHWTQVSIGSGSGGFFAASPNLISFHLNSETR